jgi:beta-phosphoglucomutase
MTYGKGPVPVSQEPQTLSAGIFDVDGVLLASPHERAWREALGNPCDEARFTTAMYQSQVAGKLRCTVNSGHSFLKQPVVFC